MHGTDHSLIYVFFKSFFHIEKFINIVVVLAYLYKVYKNYMYLPGQEKVHGRSQSRTAVVFGCGQMSIYERPPAAGLQNFFQAWYLHILCCILTLIEKELKSI